MKAEINKVGAKLRRQFALEMFKIPKAVRAMNFMDLQDQYNGDFSAPQKKVVLDKMKDAMEMPAPPSTLRRSKRGAKTTSTPATAVSWQHISSNIIPLLNCLFIYYWEFFLGVAPL